MMKNLKFRQQILKLKITRNLRASVSSHYPQHTTYLQSGQSLFEVVFAVAISALIVTGIVSLATTAVRNTSFSRNNSLATQYTKEATEWLREQRDEDWNNLDSRTPTGSPISLGSLSWGSANPISGTIFSRTVELGYLTTVNPNDTIEVTVRVTWQDAQGAHEVTNVTRFTDWNK